MLYQISPAEIRYELQHIEDDRRASFIISLSICTSLAVVTTVLRFVSRRVSKASVQADDYWVLIALVRSFDLRARECDLFAPFTPLKNS